MEEYKILLSEDSFTNLCKSGFLIYQSKTGRNEIYMTKDDIVTLAKGNILEKIEGDVYKVWLPNMDYDLAKEIIRRSPMYSDLYNIL